MSKSFNIAWIIPKRLGDAIFITPSIRLVYHNIPNPTIDIITFTDLSNEVFMFSPYINEALCNPSDKTLQSRQGYYNRVVCSSKITLGYHCIKQLFTLSYCLGFTGLTYTEKHCVASFLYSTKEAFQIDEKKDDFSYDLFPQEIHFNSVRTKINENAELAKYRVKIGFHVGCHGIAKKSFWSVPKHKKIWNYSQCLEFCRMVEKRISNCALIVTGTQSEARIAKKLENDCKSVFNWVGKTSVLELAALMGSLDIYICPDTGPMHVACATEVPVIGIFGSTDPNETGPYPGRKNFTILKKNCMSQIQPDEVVDALHDMLGMEIDKK